MLRLCTGRHRCRPPGNIIWAIAHASPVYFAVGALEDAVHGLRVTPEPPLADVAVLLAWAVLSVLVASAVLSRRVATR
jgi:hypothetical protein